MKSTMTIIATLALGFLSSAGNATVMNIMDSRSVNIYGETTWPVFNFDGPSYSNNATPALDFSSFDESLSDSARWATCVGLCDVATVGGSASQRSSMTAESYMATGSANLSFDDGDAFLAAHGISESIFDIEFAIDSPYRYKLAGEIFGEATNHLHYVASVSLLSDSGTVLEFSKGIIGDDAFDVSGILDSGVYTLRGLALVEDLTEFPWPALSFGSAEYDFVLDLAPVTVAEPAVLWLLASGLVGLIAVAGRNPFHRLQDL